MSNHSASKTKLADALVAIITGDSIRIATESALTFAEFIVIGEVPVFITSTIISFGAPSTKRTLVSFLVVNCSRLILENIPPIKTTKSKHIMYFLLESEG